MGEARDEDKVERPLADHLVGDVDVTAKGVASFRCLHSGVSSTEPAATMISERTTQGYLLKEDWPGVGQRSGMPPESGFGVWLEPQLPGDSFLLLEQ
jgi:hypothetical protein